MEEREGRMETKEGMGEAEKQRGGEKGNKYKKMKNSRRRKRCKER